MLSVNILRSHRLRLALVSIVVTALLLTGAFAGIIQWTKGFRLNLVERELRFVANEIQKEGLHKIDFQELRDDHPGLVISVVKPNGVEKRYGRMSLSPEMGFVKVGDVIQYGRTIQGETVYAALSWKDAKNDIKQLTTLLFILIIPLSLLAGITSWFAAHAIFRPIQDIISQANLIGIEKRSGRITVKDKAEILALADQLNVMLDRLDALSSREERFSQDVAHELRTPLAVIRAQIETTLLNPRTIDEYIEAQRLLLFQAERLSDLTNYLLLSAKDSINSPEPVNLDAEIRTVLSRAGTVKVSYSGQQALVRLERIEVDLLLVNLLENARTHAVGATQVKIELSSDGELIVSDNGPGFYSEVLNIALERFAKSPSSSGSGLGLALCKQIVVSRGGEIELSNHGGAVIRIKFPVWSEQSDSTLVAV